MTNATNAAMVDLVLFSELSAAILLVLPEVIDGMSPEAIRAIIEDKDEFTNVLRQAFLKTEAESSDEDDDEDEAEEVEETAQPTVTSLRVVVNHDLTLEQRIEAGKYDWKNSDITSEHFPKTDALTGTEEVELQLVHFDRYISTEDALKELDQMGMKPAGPTYLFSVGEQHSELQRKFPIVELDQVWRHPDGGRVVVCLVSRALGRYLYLDTIEGGWGDDYRFLAIRK